MMLLTDAAGWNDCGMNSCIPLCGHSDEDCLVCDAAETGVPASWVSESSTKLRITIRQNVPVDFGVKMAAAAAFGEIPRLFGATGCTIFVTGERGVKDGESTLRKRLALC